jgi:peptidoglycan/LPS O-acetylase OafA/YrhL
MDIDGALVRRAIVAWWALLAVGWLVLAVTGSTAARAFDLEDLALGLAVVGGGAGVVVVADADEQARRLAGALFVVGGTALVVTTVGVTGLPVASGTLSPVADITFLGTTLLVLSNQLGGADDSSS